MTEVIEKTIFSSKEEIEAKGYKVSFMGLFKICGRKEARILVKKLLTKGLTPSVSVKIGTFLNYEEDQLMNEIRWVDSEKFATRTGLKKETYSWLSGGYERFGIKQYGLGLVPRRSGPRGPVRSVRKTK